ncbi:MAG TPA: DUF4861 family protein [Pyrinomonadaceae bacterium]|nr:DUF4861 family protein [Pyrinomonadaceae bacterium]
MSKILARLLAPCLLLAAAANAAAQVSPRLKVVKLSVSNPTALARPNENVTVGVADLRRVAPDFKAVAFVVTASDAAPVEADARALRAGEVPSQADDLDGDGKYDEIAFQIELKPNQTRVVSVVYGDVATIQRLRGDYPRLTDARFAAKFEGVGWESELAAWRLYFDRRNAIDMFGKRRPGLYLELFGSPEYDYHEESPFGRDIYKIGDALGIGAVGALVEGKAVRVSDVAERSWRVVTTGPVRSVVELTYKGWKVGGREVNLTSRIHQWAGNRGFAHRVTAEGAEGLTLVTGLVRKPNLSEHKSEPTADVPALWRATWGPQVLKTGATASDSLPDQNLGLAIVAPGRASRLVADDALNLLLQPAFERGEAAWYVVGAWDQEGTEAVGANAPPGRVTTREGFLSLVRNVSERVSRPARVTVVSQKGE